MTTLTFKFDGYFKRILMDSCSLLLIPGARFCSVTAHPTLSAVRMWNYKTWTTRHESSSALPREEGRNTKNCSSWNKRLSPFVNKAQEQVGSSKRRPVCSLLSELSWPPLFMCSWKSGPTVFFEDWKIAFVLKSWQHCSRVLALLFAGILNYDSFEIFGRHKKICEVR
jgi:hypothetical protein